MSDFLSSITSGLSSLSSLLGGGPAVQLDNFVFSGFEVPERMRWGGDQSGTMHKLIGGGRRVLDLTGPDDAPIEWSGVLLGADAKGRARELDALRQEGGPFNLDWAESSQRVWVRSCRFDEGFNQIRYDIVCEIIPEDDAPDDDLTPAGAVKDVLRQDGAVASVTSALSDVNKSVAPIVGQITTVATQVRATGAALLGTVSNVSALASLASVHLSLGTTLAGAEGLLNGSTGNIFNTASGFLGVLSAANTAAAAAGALGKLSRATTLLGG